MSEAELQSSAVPGTSDSSTLSDTSATSTGNLASASASAEKSTSTLLSKLPQPVHSKLARIRKTQWNPPIGKKRSAVSRSAHAPTNVQPVDRVKQYPNEHFIVSAKSFFLRCMWEVVSTKKSVIDFCTISQRSTKTEERQKNSEQIIAEALKSYENSHHGAGQSLPDETWVFRVIVVKIPLPLSTVFA